MINKRWKNEKMVIIQAGGLFLTRHSERRYDVRSFSDQRYGTDADNIKSKGLLTGTIVMMLDNPGMRFSTVYYYDSRGRMIQYHPGTPRHFGGAPYWKISSGSGTIRIPVY